MEVAKSYPATIDQFLAIPDDERFHELIDGELVQKCQPTREHGSAQIAVGAKIFGPYNRRPGGKWPGGWRFATEVEIRFEREILRPDVMGWKRERFTEPPTGSPVSVAPDWVCEVLSKNKRNDLVKKKRTYHRFKVGHYWIIDPEEETFLVYRWSADGYLEVLTAQTGERVTPEPFDAINLNVGVLFGEDDDE